MTSHCRIASGFVLALAALITSSVLPLARGADDLRDSTSLRFVPADTSFYAAMLRNQEQLDIFLKSNVYAKLRNLPLMTFGLSMWQSQWDNPTNDELRVFKEIWEKEENQQLVSVLLDAVSQEVFVYGDAGWADILVVAQEFQRLARVAQVRAARDGETDESTEKEILKAALSKLESLKAPGTVLGFKISDGAAAQAQIDRLEKTVREFFESQDELQKLKDRLKQTTIGNGKFLVLELDGTLIPWDEMPEETKERLGEAGRAEIEKLKLTISLGVKDGYLLVGLGDSTDLLKKMGGGKLLIDVPEFAPLRKHADRRIVSVGFASKSFMERANSISGQIDDMASTIETLLPAAELDEEVSKAILDDVKQMATELKSFVPRPGAVASFAFLTDRGYEGFEYNWTEPKGIDGSQQLGILRHVGGDPVGFAVGRSAYHPEAYDWIVKWAGRAWGHAEKVMAAKLDDEERQRLEQIRQKTRPLVRRFHEATKNDLIPALKDGQTAIVLDSKSQSKQWHQGLPSTRVALPMLELAIVCGVSDSVALKRAGAEYFAIIQAALDVAHELGEGEVPKVELPAPKLEATDAGDLYSYPLPEQVGMDKQLAPNVGVSRDTLVFSLFPEQTKRLLTSTDLKQVGPLSRSSQPLAGAAYFNFAGLIDAITPWVSYSVRIAGEVDGENAQQARMAAQMVVGNVTPILDILKSLGEYASVTYIEDGAIVKHSASIYVDAN